MHGTSGCPTTREITQGDTWLSQQIPMIMGSTAYRDGGAIFVIWDESEGGAFPIGMIADLFPSFSTQLRPGMPGTGIDAIA